MANDAPVWLRIEMLTQSASTRDSYHVPVQGW